MPQVNQITPQKRKGIFNIYIDGEFAFGLDAESLVKEKLVEGLILKESDVERLKEISLYSKLLGSALNFLSFRPRSKKEVERNLDQKIYKMLENKDLFFSKKIKDQVISKIESLGFVNDTDFARWWVEQRSRAGKGARGPILIKRELLAKGISREITDQVLADHKPIVSAEVIFKLLGKKDRNLKGEIPQKRRQKLLEHLLRRGYEFEAARAAVAGYLKSE